MNMVRSQGSRGCSTRCQDCGNQAKKDCIYMRCRTCCRSKGFECQTHVKSTWVPSYRRRHSHGADHHHHHLHHLPINPHHHHHQHHHHQHNPKRLRQETSSSSIGLEMENFPAEVSSTATFRCFRVSPMDGAETTVDECAYQTSVSIGGHLFKGILYDQGPEHYCQDFGESSSNQPHQDPNFTVYTAAAGALASTSGGGAQESTLAPPSTYPFPLNAFMSGLEMENFPAEVSSTATFRCFRVSRMDGAETTVDECAYQTSVSIGGHLFKGILYDQGPEHYCQDFGESSSNQPHQDPNFTVYTAAAAAAAAGALASTSGGAQESTLAPPSTYPFPLNAFMSGTQLFLHPKS